VTVIVVFGTLAAATILPSRPVVVAGDPVETLFRALVTATITGVTLVVSINSLVLSQELGPFGDVRDRMGESTLFRQDVESESGLDVAAASPSAFLVGLVAARREAKPPPRRVRPPRPRASTPAQRTSTPLLSGGTVGVGDDLSGEQFGTFAVLSAALNRNYSRRIHEGRQLRAELEGVDNAGTSAAQAVDEQVVGIVAILTLFGPAREHIKTSYFQWEPVNLSQAIRLRCLRSSSW
jgi:hypothetical protein